MFTRRRRSEILKERKLERFVLITDPGPDPDDVKAILTLAILHKHRGVKVECIVANGGMQPDKRAALARCLLSHVGEDDIPVGIGSEGKAYTAQPHEYNIPEYELVQPHDLRQGRGLLLRVLKDAPEHSLNVICISSLRDLADIMELEPALVKEKVKLVVIQGGLEPPKVAEGANPPASPPPISEWVPDSSVNNGFDESGAAIVYSFCFREGVPMNVVSRNAVPFLPMQLARSFAQRQNRPVMTYLANAQFRGLEGLWQKICQGLLPPRCSKQWYFATFCGVPKETFDAQGFEALDEHAQIIDHLNGFVKPYDVIALMTALPKTQGAFPKDKAVHEVNGVAHHLYLEPEHCIEANEVVNLLREMYHEVTVASDARRDLPTSGRGPFSVKSSAGDVQRAKYRISRVLSMAASDAVHLWGLLGKPTQPRLSRAALAQLDRESHISTGSDVARGGSGGPQPAGVTPVDARSVGASEAPSQTRKPLPQLRGTVAIPDVAASDDATVRNSPQSTDKQGKLGGLEHVRRVPGQPVLDREIARMLNGCLEQAGFLQAMTSARALSIGLVLCLGSVAAMIVDTAVTERQLARLGIAPFDDKSFLMRLSLYNVPLITAFPVWLLALHPSEPQRALMVGTSLAMAALATAAALAFTAVVASEAEYYSDPELAFFSVQVILLPLVGVSQGWEAWSNRHTNPRNLLSTIWREAGTLLIVFFATSLGAYLSALFTSSRYQTSADGVGVQPGFGAGLLAADILHCCYALVLGGCAVHPAFRSSIQARLAHAVGAPGTLAPLAPLLGFGTGDEAEPSALATEAKHSCMGVILDDNTGDDILDRILIELKRARVGWNQAASSRNLSRNSSAASVRPHSSRSSSVSSEARNRSSSLFSEGREGRPLRRDSLDRPSHLALTSTAALAIGKREVPQGMQAPGSPPPAGTSRGTAGSKLPWDELTIDAYVVHSPLDKPEDKVAALANYCAKFQTEHGRLPIIWMDVACLDQSLTFSRRMAHLPVYLARSKTILALVGPTLVDSLQCVVELFVWTLTGGSKEHVDLVILGSAEEGQNAISAFDAFHVMWVHDEVETPYKKTLIRLVELASVSAFNEVIRSYLPYVRAAVEKAGQN